MIKLPKGKRDHPARTRSSAQEKATAKRSGGRTTRGSGNGWEKGDVRKKGVMRIECKTTTKNSFSITQEMLNKIYNAALPCNEIPIIEVEFLTPEGKVCRSVAVVPSYVIEEIANAAE